jgi:hypothetical protein
MKNSTPRNTPAATTSVEGEEEAESVLKDEISEVGETGGREVVASVNVVDGRAVVRTEAVGVLVAVVVTVVDGLVEVAVAELVVVNASVVDEVGMLDINNMQCKGW